MQAIKNAAISAKILAQVQAGAALPTAIDAVLGEGTYARLVGELYDELRAKAGK